MQVNRVNKRTNNPKKCNEKMERPSDDPAWPGTARGCVRDQYRYNYPHQPLFLPFLSLFFFLSQQSARLITPNLTFWPISHIPLLLVCGGVLSARSPQVMTETTNTSLEKELHRPFAETMVNK